MIQSSITNAHCPRCGSAWTAKALGYMSSSVLIDGYADLQLGNGRACCIDLKTGTETWRISSLGQDRRMVANRDRILALDKRGEMLLIAARPREFRLLHRKEIASAESWALDVCGEMVFVRDLRRISAFVWR